MMEKQKKRIFVGDGEETASLTTPKKRPALQYAKTDYQTINL